MAPPAQELGLTPRSHEGEYPNSWMVYFVENQKKTWMMNEGSTIFGQFNYVAFMQPLIRGKMMSARCFFSARNTWFNHQTWWICQETTIGYHGMSWCAWKAWVTQEAMASLPRPVGKSWFPWVGNCKNQSNQGHFSWDKSAELRSLANWLVSPMPREVPFLVEGGSFPHPFLTTDDYSLFFEGFSRFPNLYPLVI